MSSAVSKKISTRLTMPGQVHKAYKVMLKLLHPKYLTQDKKIPLRVLKNAKGIAFITVVKAGFVFSGTLGSGIVVAKLPDGTWSGPSSIGVAGMGWGALIGASVTDSVIVLNNDLAVKAFSGNGQIKFGGSLSIAAGPIGREGEGSAHVGDGGVAACYSYSHSRGLFAGLSLQGAILMTRHGDNTKYYGCQVKPIDVLRGKVTPPEFDDLRKLYDVLATIDNPSEAVAAKAFRDVSGVSFTSSQGASFHSHKFQDDDDDDDDGFSSRKTSLSGTGGGFAWGQDEDDDELAKAVMATVITEKSDDLAPGWVKVNTESGQPYYWHEASGKTQWEKPAKIPTAVPVQVPVAPPRAKSEESDALPPGWVKVMSGDGKPYYWHEDKNITQWERPQMPTSLPAVAASAGPVIPPRRSVSNPMNVAAAQQNVNGLARAVSSTQNPLTPQQTQQAIRFAALNSNVTSANGTQNPLTPQQTQQALRFAAANSNVTMNGVSAVQSSSNAMRPVIPARAKSTTASQPQPASNPFDTF